MADPKGQVAMGTVYPPQQPMAVPYGQPMMAQPMQPVAVAQAMPVQQVAVAQPMPVQPVAAAPMGFGDSGRPPPPGAPPGEGDIRDSIVGSSTLLSALGVRPMMDVMW